jgi:hypothetical protein
MLHKLLCWLLGHRWTPTSEYMTRFVCIRCLTTQNVKSGAEVPAGVKIKQ